MLYQQAAQDVVFKEAYLTPEELKKKWGAENFENYYKKLREVLDETETQVLFYQDSYAWVPYHQSSNGKTRSGKEVIGGDTYPYLATRECLEDVKAEDEMHVYQFSYDEIKKKCRSFLEAAEGEAEAKKALKFEDFEIQEKILQDMFPNFGLETRSAAEMNFEMRYLLHPVHFPYRKNQEDSKSPQWEKGTDLG